MLRRNKPLWAKKVKKTIYRDPVTGEEHILSSNPRIKTKYGKTECSGGCREGSPRFHHSREEALYCNKLSILKKCGEIKDYRAQVRFDLHGPDGKYIHKYMVVDFVVTNFDRSEEIHEYKGYKTEEWKLKYELFRWCYPDMIYLLKTVKDLI